MTMPVDVTRMTERRVGMPAMKKHALPRRHALAMAACSALKAGPARGQTSDTSKEVSATTTVGPGSNSTA